MTESGGNLVELMENVGFKGSVFHFYERATTVVSVDLYLVFLSTLFSEKCTVLLFGFSTL
jgi:hypothetical protein